MVRPPLGNRASWMDVRPVETENRMDTFWKLFDRLIDAMAALAGVLLLFITAAMCYSIGMRFLFTKTTLWIIPIAEYALVWVVFLATTWLLREKGHITTDLIYSHLSLRKRACLDFIMFFMGGLSCGTLFGFGVFHLWECLKGDITDVRAITVPKGAVFAIIPVGSLLLALQFIRMAVQQRLAMKRGG